MNLLSFGFYEFLFVLFIVYFLLGGFMPRYQWCALLGFSIFFYYKAGAIFFIPLSAMILLTFFGAMLMEKMQEGPGRKAVFAVFMILAIGTLALYKYSAFLPEDLAVKDSLIMPLGISFYTFQSTGYFIDVYKKKYAAEKNILKYALFVSFFPQIGQGPIGRYDKLSPQLFTSHEFDPDAFRKGAVRVICGIFKKAVIANQLSLFVTHVYGNIGSYSGIVLIINSFLYTIMLYMDFSGYMDIVLGIGMQLGIKLDENFKTPYFAVSISDFWRRWHITLSSWLRDYVYIPLGGSRKGMMRKCLNIMIVMLISGIWHGTGWCFIIWGALHGVCQVVENFLPGYKSKEPPKGAVKYARMVLTFLIVNLAWVFFAVNDIHLIGAIFAQITTAFRIPGWTHTVVNVDSYYKAYWIYLAAAILIAFIMELIETKQRFYEYIFEKPAAVRYLTVGLLLMMALMFMFDPNTSANNFIYYKF